MLSGLLLTACDLLAPDDGPQLPEETNTTLTDPLDDLYDAGGQPASGPDWQDITEVDVTRTDETIEFTITCRDDYPTTPVDVVTYILIDIDADGQVVPPDGVIDFYQGDLDYGVFIPSPEFGEPPIFIEDLQLKGQGTVDTQGAQYTTDGETIEIEIDPEHIGDPQGTIRFVAAIRTGIMSQPIEDRVPNEGLAEIAPPGSTSEP